MCLGIAAESKVPSQEWGGEGEAGKTSPGHLSTFPRCQATISNSQATVTVHASPRPWESAQIELTPQPLSPVLRPSHDPPWLLATQRAREGPCWTQSCGRRQAGLERVGVGNWKRCLCASPDMLPKREPTCPGGKPKTCTKHAAVSQGAAEEAEEEFRPGVCRPGPNFCPSPPDFMAVEKLFKHSPVLVFTCQLRVLLTLAPQNSVRTSGYFPEELAQQRTWQVPPRLRGLVVVVTTVMVV